MNRNFIITFVTEELEIIKPMSKFARLSIQAPYFPGHLRKCLIWAGRTYFRCGDYLKAHSFRKIYTTAKLNTDEAQVPICIVVLDSKLIDKQNFYFLDPEWVKDQNYGYDPNVRNAVKRLKAGKEKFWEYKF